MTYKIWNPKVGLISVTEGGHMTQKRADEPGVLSVTTSSQPQTTGGNSLVNPENHRCCADVDSQDEWAIRPAFLSPESGHFGNLYPVSRTLWG